MILEDKTYSQILLENSLIDNSNFTKELNIKVLSNTTIDQINELISFALLNFKISPKIIIGNYDNIVQETFNAEGIDVHIIMYELYAFKEKLNQNTDLSEERKLINIQDKIIGDLEIIFNNLDGVPVVFFSSLITNHLKGVFSEVNLKSMTDKINTYVENNIPKNFNIVRLNEIESRLENIKSYDLRMYNLTKSLYTINFYKEYIETILPNLVNFAGCQKKVLIMDCDNTLWKGIIGEDGIDGIKMSHNSLEGSIFSKVQKMITSLVANGAVLCLCSKNNEMDVQDVIDNHPNMQIKDEHITIKKINWDNKVSNIIKISEELNLGLDSFVFVDDSNFEISLIKEELKDVMAIQVPKDISTYVSLFCKIMSYFPRESLTGEDLNKTKMYKENLARIKHKNETKSLDNFLKTLETKMFLKINDISSIDRISQMTKKTNQFNLTAKIYTENTIGKIISEKDYTIITARVVDKFGDNGITILAIIKIDDLGKTAIIENLLMSCRVIGRNLEYEFFNQIISILKQKDVKNIKAAYIPTEKNIQVREFYNNFTSIVNNDNKDCTRYEIKIEEIEPSKIDYIEVYYE